MIIFILLISLNYYDDCLIVRQLGFVIAMIVSIIFMLFIIIFGLYLLENVCKVVFCLYFVLFVIKEVRMIIL